MLSFSLRRLLVRNELAELGELALEDGLPLAEDDERVELGLLRASSPRSAVAVASAARRAPPPPASAVSAAIARSSSASRIFFSYAWRSRAEWSICVSTYEYTSSSSPSRPRSASRSATSAL